MLSIRTDRRYNPDCIRTNDELVNAKLFHGVRRGCLGVRLYRHSCHRQYLVSIYTIFEHTYHGVLKVGIVAYVTL